MNINSLHFYKIFNNKYRSTERDPYEDKYETNMKRKKRKKIQTQVVFNPIL